MGPHYANFRAITDDLRAHNAIRIASKEELARVLIELFTNHEDAHKMGERARQVFEQQAGGTSRSINALREILDLPASPSTTVGSQRSVRRPA
jgi:3-deoxy-D-manno-octulosonic-acid transferase